MANEEVIHRKVTKLKEYVNELRKAQDINISYQSWKEPGTYREIFTVLAPNGVLPDEKVLDYQNMASFRNMPAKLCLKPTS